MVPKQFLKALTAKARPHPLLRLALPCPAKSQTANSSEFPAYHGDSVIAWTRATSAAAPAAKHAPLGRKRYGFANLSPATPTIFYNNCSKNGICRRTQRTKSKNYSSATKKKKAIR